jgi:hypothetical protein
MAQVRFFWIDPPVWFAIGVTSRTQFATTIPFFEILGRGDWDVGELREHFGIVALEAGQPAFNRTISLKDTWAK